MAKAKTNQSQEIEPSDLETPFFGADPTPELDITPEDIAIRDGVDNTTTDDDTAAATDKDDKKEDADDKNDKTGGTDDDVENDKKVDDATTADADAVTVDSTVTGNAVTLDSTATGDGVATDDPVDKDPTAIKTAAIMVPKSRMDGALRRARIAEDKLQTRDTPGGVEAVDLDALEIAVDGDTAAKMFDASMDNKPEEASKLLSTLITQGVKGSLSTVLPSLRKEITAQIQSEVDSGVNSSTNDGAFADAVDEIYTTYPFMNPVNTEIFEAEVMADARTFQAGYEAQGTSSAVAVLQATDKALHLHHPELFVKAKAAEAEAAAKKSVEDKTDAESLKRNIEAATAQPAKSEGSKPNKDEQGKVPSVDDLSDEEFDALPAATRARMRGDFA